MTRHNRIYIWAAGISAAHRYLITAALVSALWAVWFFCCYTSYNTKINAQRQELTNLHTQKTQLQCLAQACGQEEKKISELQAQLATYSEFFSTQEAHAQSQLLARAQDRMVDIIGYTKKAGLSLISCSMGAVQQLDKDEHTSTLRAAPAIALATAGTLPALYSFLATIKDSKKSIQCSRAQLEREHDGHYRMITEFYMLAFKEKKIPST